MIGAEPDNNLAVAGYKTNVYGLYLGTLNNPPIGEWKELNFGKFGAGKKEFYILTAEIEYSNFVAGGWMYAAITDSPVSYFSPKTSSAATPTPVPATIYFLVLDYSGL